MTDYTTFSNGLAFGIMLTTSFSFGFYFMAVVFGDEQKIPIMLLSLLACIAAVLYLT